MGIERQHAASVRIQQRVHAPAEEVASYIGDFRNAKEWMVGVASVEKIGDDAFRLSLESPIGRIEPEVKVLEHGSERVRWIYTSAIEGGGEVNVSPQDDGDCVVTYDGKFRLKQRLLGRVVRAVGMDRFARRNGERSLARLKHLMEARRY